MRSYGDAEPVSGADFNDAKDVAFDAVVMEKRETDEARLMAGNVRHFP